MSLLIQESAELLGIHLRVAHQVSQQARVLRSPDGGWIGVETRPAAVKNFLRALAAEKGIRPSQLAVIGARTRAQLAESLGALEVDLSPAEMARLEEIMPASAVAGTRYDAHQMRVLDSERKRSRERTRVDGRCSPLSPLGRPSGHRPAGTSRKDP